MSDSPFGDISIEEFLRDYWQKKPLLVRNAFPDFEAPVGADELAGLSLEEDVESRLVVQSPDGSDWQIQHGPFDDDTFSNLPDSHWTLLVQAVDHWVPEASEIVEQFRFIPNWRYDDLMVSFASQGGGVGPHYDNYDVFLIQTQGKRRWEVGGFFDQNSPRRPDTPVMIMTEWEPEYNWVLEPGDMLYIPPQVGHNGIGESDDCMTYSVGFRAPSHAEIMRSFTDFIGEKLTSESRYTDPDLALQDNPGEIRPEALQKVREIFTSYLEDDARLGEWLGKFVTDPKYPELDQRPEQPATVDEIREALKEGDLCFIRNEGSRFSYSAGEGDEIQLYADGSCFKVSGSCGTLATSLCQSPLIVINQGEWSEQQLQLLADLYNQGSLYTE
ncbi:50S ribosomal protein L16 3-hydroxylase [Amphritea atlantica]|jgi:50S ribosomal protein L16 3-hydroxylase|uniref:50S ribosomal protein L16 3-hydroxylase n=1 Tax=Amphritea atlantica TaxID=355243 RepID=A0A1H9IRH0_9GAMM|nr:cupin domain-containing protein [Amphritea atlantica]SEQ77156.1 50S ribosomal protein L16 3-hydroxylase [Amphritea atlantica]